MDHRRLIARWLWLVPAIASAHHSGIYDENRVIAIEGTIAAVAWVNPHVRLTVENVDAAGASESWVLEGASANLLERWGIEPARLGIGQRIRAEGPASRFDVHGMIAAIVELANGDTLLLWPDVATRLGLAKNLVGAAFPPPVGPATSEVSGIFRVWTPHRRPGTDLAALPLTAPARETANAYDARSDDPGLRCEPPGMPRMLETSYPVEFVDRGETIVMRFEEFDGERTIYLDPRNGPPTQQASPKGVSFGRWEGSTLAVFTTYIEYPYFDSRGTPLSGSATVLERYTPSRDGTRLDWQATVTDPTTFTSPVILAGLMTYEPGETVRPYDCTLPDPRR